MFSKRAINIAGDYFVGFIGQLKSGSTSMKASVDRFLYLRTVLFEISLWFEDLWLAASSSCTLSDIPLCRLTMSPQTQKPFGAGVLWVLRSGGISRVVQYLARN